MFQHLQIALLSLGLTASEPLPVIVVNGDDTVIDRSCIIRIAPDTIIADVNGDGVLHIAADGITVEFEEGAVLRGAGPGAAADTFSGMGVGLAGHRNVTIRGARIEGFRIGLHAEHADGLTIERADLSGNFQQRLRSTPQAEESGDWLWPHDNDKGEWLSRYGAALSVRNSSDVTIRNVRVRRGQNGIVLDRVNDSRIYDNDCSFLSGWGLAMWRSNRNIISRNAFDFCIRGYSHGVYNRGQDSAGILMFEQCEENLIAENSATHGGDGLFGFAGKEALGERMPEADADDFFSRPRGNNGNIIVGNDFSYAAAHGLEMTFSHGNRIENNRFVNNAICGIWGGYSQDTLIVGNLFEANGDAGYGLERGGVNIEHGSGNQIRNNTFRQNTAAVHLWWDNDGPLLERPGIKPHYRAVSGNIIAGNTFEGDKVVLHLRDASPAEGDPKVTGTVYQDNTTIEVAKELELPARLTVEQSGPLAPLPPLEYEALGESRPVGARSALAGRENIVMTAWGPWDHEGPFVRTLSKSGRYHMYEFLNLDGKFVRTFVNDLTTDRARMVENTGRWATTIAAPWAGIFPYKIVIDMPGFERVIAGALLSARWDISFFPWEGSLNPPLPPEDLEAWRALSDAPGAVKVQHDEVNFRFAHGGPGQFKISEDLAAAGFKRDFFGMIAKTRVPMPAGEYRIRTLSDDGVRVMVNGQTVLENWTHHGPTRDTAVFKLDRSGEVELTVEYFEIAGYAVLEFEIEPTFLDELRRQAP
jgi:parallel beta-helix repeat protein